MKFREFVGIGTATSGRYPKGSGEHPRDGGGRPTPTIAKDPEKVRRAKQSYKPMTPEKLDIATQNEVRVAKAVGGKALPDREPFDVITDKNCIEVKTIIDGETGKITIHPDSMVEKVAEMKRTGLTPHVVVIVEKTKQVYYKAGLGSYRTTAMKNVTWEELGEIIR